MVTKVVQLWAEGLAPGWDSLFRADGSARAVELGGGARLDWFDLGPPLDLDAMLGEDPDNMTHVDIHHGADVPIPDGSAAAKELTAPKASSPGWTRTGT
ncbi:hypothetical protein [Micromonospora narathiwatensis]|uniref:Uncharacterized protein n=1 Tax=Micromonospora narathiwatensis TaxID=299146 RepID=A0A1A8ZAK6_9ACTN|nr:hypothetical protein [Micromonospora narathiwatensis]SBT40905.1 hypothetical protein GA0070621_1087 [Micromonospora narathiwatensis]